MVDELPHFLNVTKIEDNTFEVKQKPQSTLKLDLLKFSGYFYDGKFNASEYPVTLVYTCNNFHGKVRKILWFA